MHMTHTSGPAAPDYLTSTREYRERDELNFAMEHDRAVRANYEEHHTPPVPVDLIGVWEEATAEADAEVARFKELLEDEVPRGAVTRKEQMCLDSMRAVWREEIRKRLIAERTLAHERTR